MRRTKHYAKKCKNFRLHFKNFLAKFRIFSRKWIKQSKCENDAKFRKKWENFVKRLFKFLLFRMIPTWKDVNTRFTTAPLKPLSDHFSGTHFFFKVLKFFLFWWLLYVFLQKQCASSFVAKQQFKIISFLNYKHWYLIRAWSVKLWKRVGNRALPSFLEGSL